jgi:tetratricopeptide (TPR) repeat protein
MNAVYVLIILFCLFLSLASIAGLLLNASFTRAQRSRFPWLRVLDGRQIMLTAAAVVFLLLGWAAYGLKEALLVRQSFRTVPGPGTSQVVQATEIGIELEFKDAAAHKENAARESFNTGQTNFAAGRYRQAAEDYQRSIEALPTLSATLNRGLSLRYLPDYPAAERALRLGVRLALEQHHDRFEAHFRLYLSSVLNGQARYREAHIFVAKALEIYERLGDNFGQANSHLNLGVVAQARGSYSEANYEWRKSFDAFSKAGNQLGQANVSNNLAGLYLRRLELVAAASGFTRAFKLYDGVNNRTGTARSLGGLALVRINQGRLTEALVLSNRSLDIASRQDDKEQRARSLSLIGLARDEQGLFKEAMETELVALQVAHDIGASEEEAYADILLASALSGLGRPRDAYEHARIAVDIYKRGGDSPMLSAALDQLGDCYLSGHRLADALDAFQKALAIADANRDSHGLLFEQALASGGLGMTEAALGHRERALQFLRPAHDALSHAGVKNEVSRRFEILITRLQSERRESRK